MFINHSTVRFTAIIKAFLKKMVGKHRAKKHLATIQAKATIIPRDKHNISRADISPNALKVLYRLHEAGYCAYLVGGSVRDLLLGLKPKDFDIATNAHPEQVRGLFRNCILIGRRFRLAHVRFGREIVEVATFRAAHDAEPSDNARSSEHGLIIRDNVYGTMPEDALRRDFTVNALYYNIADFSVVDYCHGMADLKHHLLRLIGDPNQRYQEDPVRILRAIRLAGKCDLTIEPQTAAPIATLNHLLAHVPPARLFDEALKLFLCGAALKVYKLLRHYGLFDHLFPQTEQALRAENHHSVQLFIETALKNTDARLAEGKTVTPMFLLAALLWYPLQKEFSTHEKQDSYTLERSAEKTLALQLKHTAMPRRVTGGIREIWTLQLRLAKPSPRNLQRTLDHQRFRAAYDFLLLRAVADHSLNDLAQWWTEIQTLDAETRHARVLEWQELHRPMPKPSANPKRKKRKKKPTVVLNSISE